jgi:hypothetical protein
MSSISLLGDAYGHIYEINVNHNYSPNNSGPLLLMAIFLPLFAILLLVLLRISQRTQAAALEAPASVGSSLRVP